MNKFLINSYNQIIFTKKVYRIVPQILNDRLLSAVVHQLFIKDGLLDNLTLNYTLLIKIKVKYSDHTTKYLTKVLELPYHFDNINYLGVLLLNKKDGIKDVAFNNKVITKVIFTYAFKRR